MRAVVMWLVVTGCGNAAAPTAVDASVDAPDAAWRFPYRACMVPADCDAATPYCCLYCGHGINCGPSTCMDKDMADGYCTVPLCDPAMPTCSTPNRSGTCQVLELPASPPVSIWRCN